MRVILPSQRMKVSTKESCSWVSCENGPPVKRPSMVVSQSWQYIRVTVISPPHKGHRVGKVFIQYLLQSHRYGYYCEERHHNMIRKVGTEASSLFSRA